ncbi:MAG: ubiquitin-conjugating enzyme E2 [Candidatus Hodarchaeota archaeon]
MRKETDFAECAGIFASNAHVSLEPWQDGGSIEHLRLDIVGLDKTPYELGKFTFEIRLPPNYPFSPPFAYCHTIVYHPNIDSTIPPGKLNICLDLINPELVGQVDVSTGASGWTPAKTLTNLIEALRGMMHVESPFFNPADPLNHEAGEEALRAWNKFARKAREWTKKYARD